LYRWATLTVENTGGWPHTINKGTVTSEAGEDVAVYQGNLYYTYNHSGSAGDIGKFDLSSTFDDDWGSTVPTGAAALQDGPHPMVVGRNDVLYVANGRYVCSFDGTTLDPQALDLPTGTVIQDMVWLQDRLWILTTGSNYSSVYVWDGAADGWESEIPVSGAAGALHEEGGIIYIWYGSDAEQRLGYINNGSVAPIDAISGEALPEFYCVTSSPGFLYTNLSGFIHAFGSGSPQVPKALSSYALATDGYLSGIGIVGGTFYVAGGTGGLGALGANSSAGEWQSLYLNPTGDFKYVKIDSIRFDFQQLETGDEGITWAIQNGRFTEESTLAGGVLGFSTLGPVSSAWIPVGKLSQAFKVKITFPGSVGDLTIKGIRIYGHTE
jgi:hypothetical protein